MLQFAGSAAMTGCMLGATVPVAWGMWMLHDFHAYTAALPPGAGVCGMPALGAWVLILFGWPIGGLVGAFLGFTCGLTYRIVVDRRPMDGD